MESGNDIYAISHPGEYYKIEKQWYEVVINILRYILRFHIMILCAAKITDKTEFRAGHQLFDISQKNLGVSAVITRVTIQVTVDNVL